MGPIEFEFGFQKNSIFSKNHIIELSADLIGHQSSHIWNYMKPEK